MPENITKDAVDLNFLTHKNKILAEQNDTLKKSLAKLEELNSQYSKAVDEAVERLNSSSVKLTNDIDTIKHSHLNLLELIELLSDYLKEYENRYGNTARGLALIKTSEVIVSHKETFK